MTARLARLAIVALAAASPLAAQVPQQEYAARRTAVATELPDGVIVAFGAQEPPQDYISFFQAPSFYWLTGVREPGAALVMVKRAGEVRTTLFVRPRDPAREVWDGARMGTDGARRLTGLDARLVRELNGYLDTLLADSAPPPVMVIGDFPGGTPEGRIGGISVDQQRVAMLRQRRPAIQVRVANDLVERLRGTKTAAELALLRRAADITVRAHREAMQAMEPGLNEFEIQGLIEYTFRRNGADRPGFASIVGSGPNSTTLHYNADDRFIQRGEMIVIDIGASYRGYTADVTRSIPATGRFTAEQRAVYQVVRDAQAAAERQVRVGAQARAMVDSSNAVIAAGLARLGLIDSATATYDCGTAERPSRCPQYRMFYMHGLGHGIGLEVHDPEQYYFTGVIQAGSAFTIEPGIYVRADVLDHLPDTPANRELIARRRAAVQRYANIGVRIEDDYVVTERGMEWISRAPREIAEIEALMARVWRGPAARDRALVEAYRQQQ